MSMQDLLPWISGANSLLILLTALYALTSAGGKKAATDLEAYKTAQGERLSKLGDRLDSHGLRIQAIETDLKHLPDRDQAHRLELAIEKLTGRMETLDERMTGRMDTLDERMKPVAAASARLQNFLMEQGAEK